MKDVYNNLIGAVLAVSLLGIFMGTVYMNAEGQREVEKLQINLELAKLKYSENNISK